MNYSILCFPFPMCEMTSKCNSFCTLCRAVPQCMPSLLEVLVALSEDEEVQVASAAGEALRLVSLKCGGDLGKSLTEVLEESFFTLASELPAIFNHAGNVIFIPITD